MAQGNLFACISPEMPDTVCYGLALDTFIHVACSFLGSRIHRTNLGLEG